MGVIKCCVPNCSSKSSSGIIMHYFPRPPNRRNLWLNQINCKYLNSLNFNQLMSKRVCTKHFERKFYENDRLNSMIARPTLFTAVEISSGIPNEQSDELYNVCKIPNCLKDHTYYNTVHVVDQQPTLRADSGTLSAGSTYALQQIENTFNSVIKPNENQPPYKKQRLDETSISVVKAKENVPPYKKQRPDETSISVVKANENVPPYKKPRPDGNDTSPTDQRTHVTFFNYYNQTNSKLLSVSSAVY